MTAPIITATTSAAGKLRGRALVRAGRLAALLAMFLIGVAPAGFAQRGNARPAGGGGGFRSVPSRPANNFRAPAQRAQTRAVPAQRQQLPAQRPQMTLQRPQAYAANPGPSRTQPGPPAEHSAGGAPVYRNGQAMGGAAPAQAARPALINPQGPQITTQAPRGVPGGGVPQMGAGNNMFQARRQAGSGPVIQRGNSPVAGQGSAPHLNQWLQQHQSQSLEQQQRALQNEPGFNRLPAEQQQRLQQRLQQLNRMPEQDRQRTLNYVEGMERLSPQQRGQVNSVLGQMHQLPQDQQRQVSRAFNQVRRLPPAERENALRGYSGQLNPQQQQTLNNLMRAEPYLPLQR